jgi:adenylate kinase family enzyme
MKTFILGNAGSGKTTLAAKLANESGAARLSLDDVAFDGGTKRRPLEESVAEVLQFIASHDSWVIEGCYADIIAAVIKEDHELCFLNPGVETCVARCRAREWEPEKFASFQDQQSHREVLIDWVRQYETRNDEYGLLAHRGLFDSFTGPKRTITREES